MDARLPFGPIETAAGTTSCPHLAAHLLELCRRPEPEISSASTPPAWSADGMELVCVNYTLAEGRHEVFAEIVSLVTRETRRFELPGIEQARLDVDWSADGRYLAYVDGGAQAAETADFRILRLSDRQTTVIPGKGLNLRRPRMVS